MNSLEIHTKEKQIKNILTTKKNNRNLQSNHTKGFLVILVVMIFLHV